MVATVLPLENDTPNKNEHTSKQQRKKRDNDFSLTSPSVCSLTRRHCQVLEHIMLLLLLLLLLVTVILPTLNAELHIRNVAARVG